MELDLSNFFPVPDRVPQRDAILKADYEIIFETANMETVEVNLDRGEIVYARQNDEGNYSIECGSPSVVLTIPEEIYNIYCREIDTSIIPKGMEYYPTLEDFLMEATDKMTVWVHDFEQNVVVRTLVVIKNWDVTLKMIGSARLYEDSGDELVAVSSKGYTLDGYGSLWAALCQNCIT